MEKAQGENKSMRRFEVGEDVVVLTGDKSYSPKRFVTIQEVFIGPDGKTWIRAWWPGMDTDPEIEMNHKLEANGLKVDPNNHIVEGPADKFR